MTMRSDTESTRATPAIGHVPRGHTAAPVVTVVVYALNEERFIAEAIQSVFAQTYSPLEIVLSDDGSTDQTFEIMREMAARYHGPHKVFLNRNPRNIGIGSQINAAVRLSTGQLIVLANGDDISLPYRVQRIVDEWEASGRSAAAICSAYEIIDTNGLRTGRVVQVERDFSDVPRSTYGRFSGPGAVSMCVSRRCFDQFGTLSETLILEDGPMNLRSTLTGSWRFIFEPLVLYRVHTENMSQAYFPSSFETWRARHRARAIWQMREGEKAYVQMLTDLYSAGADSLKDAERARARINAARRLLDYQLRSSYYSGEWAFGIWQWMGFCFRLIELTVRVAIKRVWPMIENRNDRWHYRSVLAAAEKASQTLEKK